MTITILQSEAGAGKTNACCGWEEPIHFLNLEDNKDDADNRLTKLIQKYHSTRIITQVDLMEIYLKDCTVGKIQKRAYEIDGINSLKGFTKEVKNIIEGKVDAVTVIVDGISDLRDYAHEMWCFENGRMHAVNAGDWGEVNYLVERNLRPLVQFCKHKGIHLVMTAQYKDDYQKIVEKDKDGKKVERSVKSGRVPNYKEWEAYGVNTIIELIAEKDATRTPTGKYLARCEKSIVGTWNADITGKSLFEVLREKGV